MSIRIIPCKTPWVIFGFDRAFFNSVPGNGVIPGDITVTFNIDMAPAMDAAQNTDPNLFNPATDSVWIQWDGSLLALSQGFETFGTLDILLSDDDGDLVYSTDFTMTDGWYQFAFNVFYGNQMDSYVQTGGGFMEGRRYYKYIIPDNIDENLNTTWPATYDFPVTAWKEGNVGPANPPNLTQPTSVRDEEQSIPGTFELSQNFPNPIQPGDHNSLPGLPEIPTSRSRSTT